MSQSERDWKYLRKLQPELLAALCNRINQQAMAIIQSGETSPHEAYLKLYKHLKDSDQIVAECFNDWTRSNVWLKALRLRQERLLTDAHLEHLSNEARDRLNRSDIRPRSP